MKRETFENWAKEKGYRGGFAGLGLLDFVRETLEKRKDDGEFAPGFFEENLDSFAYLEKSSTRRPKSILIVAVPA